MILFNFRKKKYCIYIDQFIFICFLWSIVFADTHFGWSGSSDWCEWIHTWVGGGRGKSHRQFLLLKEFVYGYFRPANTHTRAHAQPNQKWVSGNSCVNTDAFVYLTSSSSSSSSFSVVFVAVGIHSYWHTMHCHCCCVCHICNGEQSAYQLRSVEKLNRCLREKKRILLIYYNFVFAFIVKK